MIIENRLIKSPDVLPSPEKLIQNFPLSSEVKQKVIESRRDIANIIQGDDSRLLVIVGPCSIHDVQAAKEYAALLRSAAKQFSHKLFIVMRMYFEKPRTVLGWKGFINDPHLDNSFDIHYGLTSARKLLLDVLALGVPTATEFLDPLVPNYLSDLICWSAIGARTSESQIHRELASGLPMPVGFKNSTDGNIQSAIDGVIAARHAHHYLSLSPAGVGRIAHTTGNQLCHIVLRGGNTITNYSAADVDAATSALRKKNLLPRLMIDCSHGNSMKNYRQQETVVHAVSAQIRENRNHIFGVMLESHLVAGKQTVVPGQPLVYGQSITDACLSWDDTLPLLQQLAST